MDETKNENLFESEDLDIEELREDPSSKYDPEYMQTLDSFFKALRIVADKIPDDLSRANIRRWQKSKNAALKNAGITLENISGFLPKGYLKSTFFGDRIIPDYVVEEPPKYHAELTSMAIIEIAEQYALVIAYILTNKELPQKPNKDHAMQYLLSSKYPTHHYIPNNKLTNLLQSGIIDGEEHNIRVSKRNAPLVTTYAIATFRGNIGESLKNNSVTEFDRQVFNAIVSLCSNKNQYAVFTAESLYRIMTHQTQSETPSKRITELITASIEKLWHIFLDVDATEEMQSRNLIPEDQPGESTKVKFRGYILDLNSWDLESTRTEKNGNSTIVKTTIYYLLSEPIPYKYSKMINEVIDVDPKLLDIKEVDRNGVVSTKHISNTESRIAVKGYLLRRIEIMKSDLERAKELQRKKNAREKKANKELSDIVLTQERTILMSTVFDIADISSPDLKTDTRKYIVDVLTYYKAVGEIKGFKRRKSGKSFDAVKIVLPNDNSNTKEDGNIWY